MTLDQSIITELATMYLRAERDAVPVPPWRERFPGVTEDDAYAIQSELLRLHLADGATLAGWKAGATNPGAQANFELREAVYGRLLGERRLSSGDLADGQAHPPPRGVRGRLCPRPRPARPRCDGRDSPGRRAGHARRV